MFLLALPIDFLGVNSDSMAGGGRIGFRSALEVRGFCSHENFHFCKFFRSRAEVINVPSYIETSSKNLRPRNTLRPFRIS